MNWEQIQGKWQEYRGQVKQRWGKLTDNDLTIIHGKRDVLAGKLLTTYGNTKEQEASCKACDTAKPQVLIDVVTIRVKAIEVRDLERRLTELEKAAESVELPGRR